MNNTLITIIVSMITGIIGTVAGISGLILGILNYNRDKPNVQILLAWDMHEIEDSASNKNKLFGMVSVTNTGRRPIFVSHTYIEIPHTKGMIVINDALIGAKLLEGDAPKRYQIKQEGLEEYADKWKGMRAVIIDSTGKKYYSKPIEEKPSWAEK